MPALTLKVGHYANHHGGLAVTRTLGRAGVPVYGVHEDRLAPAGLSRYATGRFVWPTAGEDAHQRQLLDGIASVAERIGRPALLVPTDDHAAIFVGDHADVLRRWFLFPDLSPAVVRCVTDKAALHQRCVALGVPAPSATVVTTDADLDAFATHGVFPVVAKRSRPWLLRTGRRARSTRIVPCADELRGLDISTPLLLQEHIPSSCGEDWLFHGYCDQRSECVVAFTGRKVRSFPPGAGETAYGRSEANLALETEARALCQRLGFRGVMSLDYRYDRRDGQYKLLDFNPRTGAIFRLFQTNAGVDVVHALHLDMTGREVPAGHPILGRVVVVEGYDARACRAERRAGALTAGGWISSWRSVQETAWWASDDVAPALVALGRVGADAARRLARRPSPGDAWRPAPPRFLPGRKGGRW